MSKKVLIAGESWQVHSVHTKGFDSFTTTHYGEGIEFIRTAMEKAGYEVTFLPNHLAPTEFPTTMEEIKKYDCVILSDIGSNTLLLPADTFSKSIRMPNRCDLIRDYVLDGGAFIMIGGYMSFTGINATTRYGETAISEILPVKCLQIDDRKEHPEGIFPVVVEEHEAIKGMPKDNWPHLLGYNRTEVIPEGKVIATVGGDPLIAVGDFGKGRSAVFTSDCAPHWAPPEFVQWDKYNQLWKSLLAYVIN